MKAAWIAGLLWSLAVAVLLSPADSARGEQAAPEAPVSCEGAPVAGQAPPEVAIYRPVGGSVRFEMAGFLHTIKGRAPSFDGEFWVIPGQKRLVGGWFGLDAAALTTDDEDQDRLMRERYLEVERYPFICFVPDQVQMEMPAAPPGQGYPVTARGALRLHGRTQPISLSATMTLEGDELRVVGKKRLLLADYGIPVPTFLFFRTSEWVDVGFDLTVGPLSVPAAVTPLHWERGAPARSE